MVNILSLNVNSLNDQSKRDALLVWLQALVPGPDIVCLQETHIVDNRTFSSWLQGSPFGFFASGGSNHSGGVAILFRSSFSILQSWATDDGRFLQVHLTSNFHDFRVCSVYAPNQSNEKLPFFLNIAKYASTSFPTFLAGDFNSVFDRSLDCSDRSSGFTHRDSSDQLLQLFNYFDVVDQWRTRCW